MKLYVFIAISLLSLLAGCDIPKERYRPGYISSYHYFNPHDTKVFYQQDTFTINCSNNNEFEDIYVTSHNYLFGNNTTLAQCYYELCKKFGDISENGFLTSNLDNGLIPWASFEIVKHVSVVSDNDWSTDRAAGKSLNDMFTIRYFSYFPYISSRYTGAPLTSFTKPLSDLKEDEMKLIMNNIELSCTTLPTASQHHTLTISFDLDTDRTATYEVELDFAATEAQHI